MIDVFHLVGLSQIRPAAGLRVSPHHLPPEGATLCVGANRRQGSGGMAPSMAPTRAAPRLFEQEKNRP